MLPDGLAYSEVTGSNLVSKTHPNPDEKYTLFNCGSSFPSRLFWSALPTSDTVGGCSSLVERFRSRMTHDMIIVTN